MPVAIVVLNVIFALGVVVGIAGGIFHAIATQHRDHGVLASGPLLRRRVWSRTGRSHAGPIRPWVTRNGQAWPVA
jgi:hypothetical protein